MRTPTASELLSLWESACDRRAAERSLALLALALPELGYEGAARCSIGTRDSYLLSLRASLFGDELASLAHCPSCQTMVETNWQAAQLRASFAAPAGNADGEGDHFTLQSGACRIAYRLPTTDDVLALDGMADPAAARAILLERCVIDAYCDGARIAPSCLPAQAVAVLEDAMAAADPMADVTCALQCPACGHGWSIGFDIGRYLWAEIHAWAQRLLVDVHKLARAYGWREADILAMSPGRRALYVEMSGS
jgi:hypothetical protein